MYCQGRVPSTAVLGALHAALPGRHDGGPARRRPLPCSSPHRDVEAATLEAAPPHAAESVADSLPPLVSRLLETPGLECPEGMTPAHMLRVTEAYWKAMRDPRLSSKPRPRVVTRDSGPSGTPPDFDVCVAGGTLGILIALALQLRGHRVCVVEKRLLQGRSQEWNVSRMELAVLVDSGLLAAGELECCIATEWRSNRLGIKGGRDVWVDSVLNLGVAPKLLIEALRRRFEGAGGVLLERTAFKSASVYDDSVEVQLQRAGGSMPLTPGDVNRPTAIERTSDREPAAAGTRGERQAAELWSEAPSRGNGTRSGSSSNGAQPRRERLSCRLLLDCMGHFSPIVKQIRSGQRPDGMVLVVGGCFTGAAAGRNASGDLIYTFTDAADDMQLFWEAFPAEGGRSRTAYAFAYTDVHPSRPSFASLLETYLRLLPSYQGAPLSQLRFKRILMGGFPCYMGSSPLPPAFDRVLQVGDAAAAQSPLSFGGFGAMLRHLPRLARGVDDALREERLVRRELAWLQPYQPALSVSWLFQRAMAIGVGQLQRERGDDSSAAAPGLARPAAGDRLGSAAAGGGGGNEAESDSKERWRAVVRGWLPPDHVNRLMRCNFAVMQALGDRVLRPFVQDSMQLGPLALTMLCMMCRDPVVVVRVAFQLGPLMILRWFKDFLALGAYTALHAVLCLLRPLARAYRFRRLLDALRWGSSADYRYEAASTSGGGGRHGGASMHPGSSSA